MVIPSIRLHANWPFSAFAFICRWYSISVFALHTAYTCSSWSRAEYAVYNNRRLPIGATYPVQLLFFYYSRLVPDGTVRFYFLFEHPHFTEIGRRRPVKLLSLQDSQVSLFTKVFFYLVLNPLIQCFFLVWAGDCFFVCLRFAGIAGKSREDVICSS